MSIHHLPNQVDADSTGTDLVVGYGDYLSPVLVTDDPWRLPRGQQLTLALRASPGADEVDPRPVGHENATGSFEDDFVRYECRLRASPANVLALRATGFRWTEAAERLAGPVAPPDGAVEEVRQGMAELARQAVAMHDRFHELVRRLREVGRGTPGADALAAELRGLLGDGPSRAANAVPGASGSVGGDGGTR